MSGVAARTHRNVELLVSGRWTAVAASTFAETRRYGCPPGPAGQGLEKPQAIRQGPEISCATLVRTTSACATPCGETGGADKLEGGVSARAISGSSTQRQVMQERNSANAIRAPQSRLVKPVSGPRRRQVMKKPPDVGGSLEGRRFLRSGHTLPEDIYIRRSDDQGWLHLCPTLFCPAQIPH